MEIRFLTMPRETSMFCKYTGKEEILMEPTTRIGSLGPLPTMI
jgi:hypothetical protein